MAVPVEEAVLNALRGHLSENTKLPAPLIIKVYVAALKKGAYSIYFFFVVIILMYYISILCIQIHSYSIDIKMENEN